MLLTVGFSLLYKTHNVQQSCIFKASGVREVDPSCDESAAMFPSITGRKGRLYVFIEENTKRSVQDPLLHSHLSSTKFMQMVGLQGSKA